MGVPGPAALLHSPGGNLGQKRQSGLIPQAHSHLHPAVKEFPGPDAEADMEGTRDQCVLQRGQPGPGLLESQVASGQP